jgi:predicted amidophosphoribosyltransferase
MPLKPFQVFSTPPCPGSYVAPYHPWKLQGQRNPAFDGHSGLCLSLKTPGNRDHQKAVNYFTRLLVDHFKAHKGQFRAELIAVPSHTANGHSAGLRSVIDAVCKADNRLSHRPGALTRVRTIEKLAAGGNRSMAVHYQSMQYDDGRSSPLTKIIIDDVTTTGNSLEAAVTLVRVAAPRAVVSCLVLGKTTHD